MNTLNRTIFNNIYNLLNKFSTIEINYDNIQYDGPLYHNLINLASYSLNLGGFKLYDMIASSICVQLKKKFFNFI